MNNRETCDIQFGLSCLFVKSGYIEDSRRAGYKLIWNTAYFEPRHDKTNKMSVRPAKTQISMGNRPVRSESSLCAQWAAKDPSFLHADSEDWSDWADAKADLSLRWAHTHFVDFVMSRLICIIIRHHYPPVTTSNDNCYSIHMGNNGCSWLLAAVYSDICIRQCLIQSGWTVSWTENIGHVTNETYG